LYKAKAQSLKQNLKLIKMKNLLYGTLFLALVGIIFVGCEKNETKTDSVYDDFVVKSDEFIQGFEYDNSSDGAKELKWYDWVAIAAADGMSGLGGAKLAATIFPPYGSIAGAILGGGVGSYTMWLEITGNSAPPPPTGGNNIVLENPNNHYEIIGQKHNQLMDELILNNLSSKTAEIYDFVLFKSGVDIFQQKKVDTRVFERVYSKSILENQMQQGSIIDLRNGQSIENFIELNLSLKRINRTQKLILAYYLKVVLRTKDLKMISKYSIFAENIILRSSILSDEEKKEILVFFTTFRYSINYWANNS
jgi:hypothetical protein